MPIIPTAPNEIDRKLHRIALDTDPKRFTNMIAFARELESKKCIEFSYARSDKTEYSNAFTIQYYISYARQIGLIDGDLSLTRPKKDIINLENFQAWLSDIVFQYLNNNNSSVNEISEAIVDLFKLSPYKLSTQSNIHSQLKNPIPLHIFKISLKIVSRLRPKALFVRSRRMVLIPGLLEE